MKKESSSPGKSNEQKQTPGQQSNNPKTNTGKGMNESSEKRSAQQTDDEEEGGTSWKSSGNQPTSPGKKK